MSTPVKNQGACGSCWAFSGTEVLETHIALKTVGFVVSSVRNLAATDDSHNLQGKLFDLAPQEYVSCMANPKQCGGTGGCEGATQWLLFDYAQKNGITLESSYPYTMRDTKCDKSKIKPVAGIEGYVRLPTNDYDALMAALQLGPVAISVSASWSAYESGIFDDVEACGTTIDHGVVAVGYGTEKGQDCEFRGTL